MSGRDFDVLVTGQELVELSSTDPLRAVAATGPGDVFTGTLVTRLAHGDSIEEAPQSGLAASSPLLAARGGASAIPTLAETRPHRETR